MVFNGPDEQLVSGLAMGADGGIGSTYGVMPELYIRIMELVKEGRIEEAQKNPVSSGCHYLCPCAPAGEICMQ